MTRSPRCWFEAGRAANMNLVAPLPGFLEGLRRSVTGGALLIFDEVITGFRLAKAEPKSTFTFHPPLVFWQGHRRRTAGRRLWRIKSDSLVARARRPGLQAGTLSGNPLATAAGVAVLELVKPDDLAILSERVTNFACELQSAIREAGIFCAGAQRRRSHGSVSRARRSVGAHKLSKRRKGAL